MYERYRGVGQALDPVVNSVLESRWAHRAEMIAPSRLRSTHSDVATTLLNGRHAGDKGAGLVNKLPSGEVLPTSFDGL